MPAGVFCFSSFVFFPFFFLLFSRPVFPSEGVWILDSSIIYFCPSRPSAACEEWTAENRAWSDGA